MPLLSPDEQNDAKQLPWFVENYWKLVIGAMLGVAVTFSGFAAGGFWQTSAPAKTFAATDKESYNSIVDADTQELTVYVTRTGEKYHRASCRHLRKSKIPMSLKDAKQSYDPCSVCNPPR